MGCVQTKGRRRRAHRQLAKVALVLPLGEEPLDQWEIDLPKLSRERLAVVRAQFVPETAPVFPAKWLEVHYSVNVTFHDYQPMTMFDSIAFRACSRSVPV